MMKSVDMLLLERERILLHKSLTNKTLEKGGGGSTTLVRSPVGSREWSKNRKEKKKGGKTQELLFFYQRREEPAVQKLGEYGVGRNRKPSSITSSPNRLLFLNVARQFYASSRSQSANTKHTHT